MASSRKSASEKKSIEKEKKRPIKSKSKSHAKRKNEKSKTSNGVVSDGEARAVPPSSSDSECDAENGFETNPKPSSSAKSKKDKQKGKRERKGELEEKENANANRFPMERVRRIIRTEDSDMRITNEAVFLINKATEKFLERFCGEAYACCVQDRKKSLSYKHLSLAVSKRKRYDFLSDFVPAKVKAEDALAEIKSMELEAD